MRAVIATMGARFSHNLVRHLERATPDADRGPRRQRLRRVAAGARRCSRPATTWSPRRPRAPDPDRFAWGGEVTWRQCDVTRPRAVDRVLRDADGVCYLVHSLRRRGFADLDRVGATHVRDAASAAGVRRIVYLSGLVPAPRPRPGALAAPRLPARGRARARRGRLLDPERAGGGGHRRRVDVVRGGAPARLAAPRPAGAVVDAQPACSRWRSPTWSGPSSRPSRRALPRATSTSAAPT